MNFYVLVPTAVYDHGVVGVYATEQLARDAAAEVWPETDGYHRFRIDVCELDRTYEDVFPYAGVPWDPRQMSEEERAEYRGDRGLVIDLHPKGVPYA